MTSDSARGAPRGPGLRLADPSLPDAPDAAFDEVLLMDRAGVASRVPLREVPGDDPMRRLATGGAEGWQIELHLEPVRDLATGWHACLVVTWEGDLPIERGVRLALRPGGDGDPDWLIPGCFYGENRSERCTRRYPRFDRLGGDPTAMVSASWSFRADRAAVPFVWCRTAARSAALAIPGGPSSEGAGFGFGAGGPSRDRPGGHAGPAQPSREGPTEGDPRIWVDLPAREEPISYDGGEARAPVAGLMVWEPGRRRTLDLLVALGPPDRATWAPLLRHLEARGGEGWRPAPWVDAEGAAALAATGLLRWHHRTDPPVLVETATFDRDLAGRPIVGEDRPDMHVGWLSGVPCAGPLLAWGRRAGDAAAIEAATAVIDHITADGVAPSGLFWGQWRADRGWTGGWNPSPGWVHVRTVGEATLFLGRALRAEAAAGVDHPAWRAAYRSNLEAIVGVAGPDGRFGTYVDAATGTVMEWEGSGGLVWIPALLEAADEAGAAGWRGDPHGASAASAASAADAARWVDAARRAGEAYAAEVEEGRLAGAPEDVHLAPSSEDGYGAVMAYTALAERDPDAARRERWLRLARTAAEWTMTFRLTHDVAWPEPSILATYGFRARGADIASPANQHLHAYGLVCVPEQLRLAAMLGDPWLRRRALDHVACWRQLIARADGDLNARRGMVTERVYHTDCFAPKGALLPLSHAWCLGLILAAALHELEHPEAHRDAPT